MRNLKKFLALVLAVMMVMGLMVTTNAADVTDATETHEAAVKVIAALGVLEGYGDDLTVVQTLTGILRVLSLKDKSTGNWTRDTLTAAYKACLITGLDTDELYGTASRAARSAGAERPDPRRGRGSLCHYSHKRGRL